MSSIQKKSLVLSGLTFVLAFFLFFGASPLSASAATWCAKDPGDVVHVFGSGPACTQGRQASWNICGGCTVWCAVGKDKKPVNVFPTNAACSQSISNSGVSGGSCRQCTSTDIVAINNKLRPYYPNSSSSGSSGFLFNFGLGGLLVPNFSGSGSSYMLYSSVDFVNPPYATPTPTSVPSGAFGSTPTPFGGIGSIDSGMSYCNAFDDTHYATFASCQGALSRQGIDSSSCGPCSDGSGSLSDGIAGNGANGLEGGGGKTIGDRMGSTVTPGDRTGRGCNTGGGSGIPNPLGTTCDLYSFFAKMLKVAEQIGGIVVVMSIIYTGFLFVKAQGNSEELETAKRAFLWTVIGAAVLLGATVLSKIIQNTINQISQIK